MPTIADALTSRAEVHGVISYYHHFRSSRPHRTRCRSAAPKPARPWAPRRCWRTPCQHLGCGLHAESGDGCFTVEPAYCLGLCASSPAITVDGQVHARMTPKKLDALVAQAQEAA